MKFSIFSTFIAIFWYNNRTMTKRSSLLLCCVLDVMYFISRNDLHTRVTNHFLKPLKSKSQDICHA